MIDESESCSKKFSKIGVRGWTFCFLIFCPKHGHAYGLHVINGAEGRKDAFYALLKYLPKAPRLIFYDFACQLSEYCINREPGFFGKTEFFHDVFHAANHKCPYAFQCSSIEDKRCYNTSCAEQFNRYFNTIKKTGRCLRLSRFMLFAQHMIYMYNLGRTKFCEKRESTIRDRVEPSVNVSMDENNID